MKAEKKKENSGGGGYAFSPSEIAINEFIAKAEAMIEKYIINPFMGKEGFIPEYAY